MSDKKLFPLHSFQEYRGALRTMELLNMQLNSNKRDAVPMDEYDQLAARIKDFEITNEIKPSCATFLYQ